LAVEQGAALAKGGRIDVAAAVYNQGIELNDLLWRSNPEDAVAGLRLARLVNQLSRDLVRAQQATAAEHYARQACGVTETVWEAHPKNVELGWEACAAHLFLGLMLRNANQLDAAVVSYQHAERVAATLVALAPTDATYLVARAQALIELGRAPEAGPIIAAALRLSPQNQWALMLQGQVDPKTPGSRGGGTG
jgi:tetratricopeptide (TPR) repeat protein